MKRLSAIFALAIGILLNAIPASAATSFVQDGAGMFSPGTVSQLNSEIANFNAQTNKQIVVVTVPSLAGATLPDAAQKTFSEQQVNGVLIFIAKDDRKDIIVPGRATAAFFPPDTLRSIRTSMESQFKNGDYDGGITTAVNSTLDIFRAHLQSAPNAGRAAGYNYPATTRGNMQRYNSGVHISMFWWILIIVVGFLIIRSIMRAASGPRYYGGGGPAGPGGAPMGGPGYGPGYGGYGPGYYGGGGGGFWSGLLGGLGGAFLGNELFGNRGGGNTYIEQPGGGVMPADQGGGWGGGADQSGWGSDAGQADMGGASSGDWSGGGFGGGDSGGGDFGGGGGGDSGGGW